MWSDFWKFPPMEQTPGGELFRLTPKQARSVRRLAKKCCNYAEGEYLPLDGVCPQAISYSLICKHFCYAVLPTKPDPEQEILHPKGLLRCAVCGTGFLAHSGRTKYCPDSAKAVHRKQKAAYARRKRSSVDNQRQKDKHLQRFFLPLIQTAIRFPQSLRKQLLFNTHRNPSIEINQPRRKEGSYGGIFDLPQVTTRKKSARLWQNSKPIRR